MKTLRRWQIVGMAGLGLVMAALTGCQAWTSGMTLPSGRYLQHPPQYFAPSPSFPLQRELATMEAQSANAALGVAPGAPALVGPPGPVPAAPAPGPAVPPMP